VNLPPPVRVVVVDDAIEIRELLRVLLTRTSEFTVVAEAADGAAGVQAVADTLPDLVLLDINMPVMDGLEALRLIRADFPDVVVVMFSAFGDPADYTKRAVKLGAHGYIRKGDTMSGLTDQLLALMSLHGHRDTANEVPPPAW
jgi:DNA-binding NarL/FixJ family response regulator